MVPVEALMERSTLLKPLCDYLGVADADCINLPTKHKSAGSNTLANSGTVVNTVVRGGVTQQPQTDAMVAEATLIVKLMMKYLRDDIAILSQHSFYKDLVSDASIEMVTSAVVDILQWEAGTDRIRQVSKLSQSNLATLN
jgi:hypothetical protein